MQLIITNTINSISTKAAFGWRYLFPNNAYAQQIFDAVKNLRSPDGGGFYAGLYEESKQPNKALTGNTNGLIMEILYYKARGNRPLIGPSGVSFAPSQSQSKPSATTPPTPTPTPTAKVNPPATPAAVTISPIPPVGKPQPSSDLALAQPLTVIQKRYAAAAWAYFQANYQSATGLVSDRSDVKGATLWGLGDYLAALHAAQALNIISPTEFDLRTRKLLAALGQMAFISAILNYPRLPIRVTNNLAYVKTRCCSEGIWERTCSRR